MKRIFIKFLNVSLALSMVCGLFSAIIPIQINAKEQLVNVAINGKATTNNGSYGGNTIDKVNDGDDATAWQTPGEWPTSATIDLNGNHNISKVVVKLGGAAGEEYRSTLITVQYIQNGITSDPIPFGTIRGSMFTDVELTVDIPVSASHIIVTLSDPEDPNVEKPGFWPAIKEIEAYEIQEVKLSNYNNIANQSKITTDGIEGNSSALLVDGKDDTLYKFHDAPLTSEKYVELNFDKARTMNAFRIAFEKVNPEPYDYTFEYSIYGKNGNREYTPIVKNATANRTDNWEQEYKFAEQAFTDVKIIMHSCTNVVDGAPGIGWPAIAEFEVYGSEVSVEDTDSIAYNKPVHSSSTKNLASKINDGSKRTAWTGIYYPGYVDIDLEENYNLDTIEIYTPANGYSQYSIYTSMDGRDFDKLAEKSSKDSADEETGEVYEANGKEARIIRVYVEYNSASTASIINEVRATGTKSNSPIQKTPEINTVTYEESAYNVAVTEQDTYDEVNGIIERRLGKEYQSWFSLELAENPTSTGYDFFELSNKNGKINIKGNDGVSLAMGLNHYLKYYCNVNISQVGDQVKMPSSIVNVDGTVFKETKVETRYSYNYCTLSYSMAFWGAEEWRNELDWLALNGVNVVLDATAQEEVWRRFLTNFNYSHQDVKDYVAGPAYYAWAYMANLSGFGGPVHDSWFEERTELARQNQLIMRKLGMQPALQGYSGMVPNDINEYDKSAEVIKQGTWCSFQRPDMLVTTSDTFDKYAELFYKAQKEVYGDVSDYYATDPFHEGGNTANMSARAIAQEVMDSMLKADANGIWIIQSWQGNPSSELLAGLEGNREHALVLDLYAEKEPHYNEGGPGKGSYGYSPEFDGTPWVFCMLNNFGGRLGLHGHLDNLANNIPKALNSTQHMTGIGIAPEASVNNPVLYDFIFETIWQDDATKDLEVINLDTWLNDYTTRRYGAESKSAQEAWSILKDTVYKAELNNKGQGAPESVVNARPALDINAASTWGNAVISYDKVKLEKAASLLLEDYETLKDSEGYLYDLATVLQQVLSNSAQNYQIEMAEAFNNGDLSLFTEQSDIFMNIIDDMEKVTSTSEYYLLGRWVEQAKALATNADDFTKELYEFNAKSLVTTWGSYNQAETGGLKDYSNRQWSGLIKDFYKVRWEKWIAERKKQLSGESPSNINWFEWEWQWARSNKEFSTTPSNEDLKVLGASILEKYSSYNPDSDNRKDIDPSKMSVYAENYQPNVKGEGDPNYVLDGNPGTIWHTEWRDTERETQYLIFTLDEATEIDGMRFLQRSGRNGVVTKFTLSVRDSEDDEWNEIITEGRLVINTAWQKITFEAINAKQIKFQVVDALSNDNNKYGAAAEIRFTATSKEVDTTVSDLTKKVEEAKAVESTLYTKDSIDALNAVIEKAEALLNDKDATAEERTAMIESIEEALNKLVERANTSDLETLIKEIEALDADKYAESSYQVLMAKVADVKAAILDGISEQEVIDYTTILNELKDNLVEVSKEVELKDDATNIVVKGELPEGVALVVDVIDEARLEEIISKINDQGYLDKYAIEMLFDIKLYVNDEIYTPEKAITVTFDLSDELLEKVLGASYIAEDGKVSILATYLDAANKKLTISVDHFSLYAIHSEKAVTPTVPDNGGTDSGSGSGADTGDTTNTGLWVTLMLGAGALLVIRKRSKKA